MLMFSINGKQKIDFALKIDFCFFVQVQESEPTLLDFLQKRFITSTHVEFKNQVL